MKTTPESNMKLANSSNKDESFKITVKNVKQETDSTSQYYVCNEDDIKKETQVDFLIESTSIKSEPLEYSPVKSECKEFIEICVPPLKREKYFSANEEDDVICGNSIKDNRFEEDDIVGQTVNIEWEKYEGDNHQELNFLVDEQYNTGLNTSLEEYNSSSDDKGHNVTEKRKEHKCEECSKSFLRLSHLKLHNFVHSGEKPFGCNLCPRKFTQSSHLNKHKTIHKRIECDYCDEVFTLSTELTAHKLSKHKKDKINQCDVCFKTFSLVGTLNRHKLLHKDIKPYECHICNLKFRQSGHLQRHMKTHSGIKEYTCTYCDKRFGASGNLQRHLLTHTKDKKYSCDLCDKKYTEVTSLKTHKIVAHSDCNPFQCDVCTKKLSDAKALRRHKLIHTGIKAFTCDICFKEFRLSCTLKRHKLLIHELRKTANDCVFENTTDEDQLPNDSGIF